MASFNWSAFWAKLTGRSKTVVVPSVQPPTPTPTPAPTPPATPAPAPAVEPVLVPSVSSADAINIRGATLLGPHSRAGDPAKARITIILKSAKMERGMLWLEYESVPSWPTGDGGLHGSCRNYIWWQAGGKVRGGHFEWSQNGRRDRGLANIKAGYLGEQPPVGAECWTTTVRNNFSERTNVVACGRWA